MKFWNVKFQLIKLIIFHLDRLVCSACIHNCEKKVFCPDKYLTIDFKSDN